MKITWESVNQATIKLLLPDSIEDTYKTIVQEAGHLLGAKYGSIHIKRGDRFARVYTTLPKSVRPKPRKRGYLFQAFNQAVPFVVPIPVMAKVHEEFHKLGEGATVFIPLTYSNTSLGVLTINIIDKKVLSKEEQEILMLFGSLCTVAIQKLQVQDEMAKTLKMRDQFISMASHELRTPLTSINGYTELLHRNRTSFEEKQAKWIVELYKETHRFIYLVHELLEVNRITAGRQKFHLKKQHLGEIVQKSIDKFKLIHKTRQFIYQNKLKGTPDSINADFEKLNELCEHLFDNAEKFSDPESRIYVALSQVKSFLVIDIKNQGIIEDKKELSHFFKQFYKGKNTVSTGMGLGLFLVQQIVEAHKGKIQMRSLTSGNVQVSVFLPKYE